MKSLKERLEEKIIEDSQTKYIDFCVGFNDSDPKEFVATYKAGAASLVPLVLELAKALEFYGNREIKLTRFNENNVIESVIFTNAFTAKADDALQSIEKFLDGK